MKKLSAAALAIVMFLGLLGGCNDATSPTDLTTLSDGETDPFSGIPYSSDTEFSYLYSSEITTLNYLATSVSQNQKPIANFIDTLVDYDAYGNMIPCLAEEWDISADGLTYTFKIREGVKWYDSEGKEVANLTANDFVTGLRWVVTSENDSDLAQMVTNYIVNAMEFYNKQIDDITLLGVEAPDDYTLIYRLKAPCPYFLTLLSYICYAPAYEEFLTAQGEQFGTSRESILYCGAYICSSWLPQEESVWVKNPGYWDADNVFITKISGIYNSQADIIAPEMYLRGEIDECKVTTSILDQWLGGENAAYVHPSISNGRVMYMLFNFNPDFSADGYDTDSYRIAVNNKNFRLAIASAFDKTKGVSAYDPYNYEAAVWNLMVPSGFAVHDGKDYTGYGELPQLAKGVYDEAAAVKYRDIAKAELVAAGAKLPIQIPLYYNPSEANQGDSCQIIQQQLEGVLGTDFIAITVLAGPSTNYIAEVRRPGKWGLFEAGWAPDYADPSTYAEPFGYGWTYGSLEYATDPAYNTGHVYTEEDYTKGVITDEELIGTQQKVYNSLVEAALAENDLDRRYEKFAKADAYLLNEVMVMPFRLHNAGYIASNMTVFDGPYSMAGVSSFRYKGRHMLESSYSIDQFNQAHAAWAAAKDGK